MRIKIMFANVIQGMIHCGYNDKKENVFTGFHPNWYVEYFHKENPDILCMAECIMDDVQAGSQFVDKIALRCQLKYCKNLVGEKAFFIDDKFYGLSVCSRFPVVKYEVAKLPNPKVETIRPNGEHWIMHDKYIQKAIVQLPDGKEINLINTHMFPFQHFNKHFWDDEFAEYRKKWASLLVCNNHKPTIITGDFNTVGITIDKAFPELDIGGSMQSLVSYDGIKYNPVYPYDTQIEYILASKEFKLLSAKEDMVYSDHPFLTAEVEI